MTVAAPKRRSPVTGSLSEGGQLRSDETRRPGEREASDGNRRLDLLFQSTGEPDLNEET